MCLYYEFCCLNLTHKIVQNQYICLFVYRTKYIKLQTLIVLFMILIIETHFENKCFTTKPGGLYPFLNGTLRAISFYGGRILMKTISKLQNYILYFF